MRGPSLRAHGALVAIAAILFVVGLFTDGTATVWVSIVVSALALAWLALSRRRA